MHARRHLETTVDISFELQIFIDKFKQTRLGARDTHSVWATVYMERLAFFVLCPRGVGGTCLFGW